MFKKNGKDYVYDGFGSGQIGYKNDLNSIFVEVQKLCQKHNLLLRDFELTTDTSYDSTDWRIEFQRPASPQEIKKEREREERNKKIRLNQYKLLKKEFG